MTIKIIHEYHALKCPRCHSELILIGADIDRATQQGREIRCPYCGARDLPEGGQFDDLLNCLLQRTPRSG